MCNHEDKHLVWTTVGSNGGPLETGRQLREQCKSCGRLLAQSKAHHLAKPDTPNVDIAALKRWNDEREQHWQANAAAYQIQRATERAEWLEQHNEYLQTPEWAAKREAVLRRSGGICEGCRQAHAVHVHHISYDHWREELSWELAAVCLDCHERAHGKAIR